MAITQQQIAKLAGVSRGTVDRVLNNRGHVNSEIEEVIREIASKNGYRPNKAGSLLVRSKRPIRLGVIIHSVETPFMATVLKEIENARNHFEELGAELIIFPNTGLDCVCQLKSIEKMCKENVQGIALTPVEDERINNKINELSAAGIPVVTFNTDTLCSSRLCYVGQDNYLSGRTCAGLMNLLLNGCGTVLMLSGYAFNRSHQQRIDGFRSEMLSAFHGISLLPLERCNDDPQTAYKIVLHFLGTHPEINGIYCAANGQSGVCKAIQEMGLLHQVHFICHDLIEDNVQNTKNGVIDFLIDQNATMQAIRPLELLVNKIISGETPSQEFIFTQIDIRNKYNI